MSTSSTPLPLRYVFGSDLRAPYVGRALFMVAAGVFSVFIGMIRDNVAQSFSGDWALFFFLKIIGGIYIVIGLAAFVIHGVAALLHQKQIIDVDEQGLKVTHFAKDGKTKTQTLKWDEVTSYRVNVRSDIEVPDAESLPAGTSILTGADGCGIAFLGSMIFGFFTLGFSTLLVPSARKSVTFNLTTNDKLSFKGFGPQMTEIVFNVLPYFLPDKIA